MNFLQNLFGKNKRGEEHEPLLSNVEQSTPPNNLSTSFNNLSTSFNNLSTSPNNLSTSPNNLSTSPNNLSTSPDESPRSVHLPALKLVEQSTPPNNLSTSPDESSRSVHLPALKLVEQSTPPNNLSTSPDESPRSISDLTQSSNTLSKLLNMFSSSKIAKIEKKLQESNNKLERIKQLIEESELHEIHLRIFLYNKLMLPYNILQGNPTS